MERVCRTCARRRSADHYRRHYVPRPRVKREKEPPKPRPAPTPVIDRIMAKVVHDGDCWIYTGATSNGYGMIQLGRGVGTAKAHRVTYDHYRGSIPKGMLISHLCHKRRCVNPDHLAVATYAENARQSVVDGWPNGRNPNPVLGSRNNKAKLTEADIPVIRADYRVLREIAAQYGISISAASNIRRRNTWRHVP